jgi:hypothetical protein
MAPVKVRTIYNSSPVAAQPLTPPSPPRLSKDYIDSNRAEKTVEREHTSSYNKANMLDNELLYPGFFATQSQIRSSVTALSTALSTAAEVQTRGVDHSFASIKPSEQPVSISDLAESKVLTCASPQLRMANNRAGVKGTGSRGTALSSWTVQIGNHRVIGRDIGPAKSSKNVLVPKNIVTGPTSSHDVSTLSNARQQGVPSDHDPHVSSGPYIAQSLQGQSRKGDFTDSEPGKSNNADHVHDARRGDSDAGKGIEIESDLFAPIVNILDLGWLMGVGQNKKLIR